jgi:hypothetical protein
MRIIIQAEFVPIPALDRGVTESGDCCDAEAWRQDAANNPTG